MAVAKLSVIVEAQVAKFQQQFAEASRTAQKFEKDFANTASSVTAQQKRINDAFASFSGDKLAREASAVAKAVKDIGGASRLTVAEQAKVNALMTEAIAKYKALGETAPKAVLDLAKATKQVEQETEKASKSAGALSGMFGQFTAANLAATAITKVTTALVDFASKGAKLQGVETSFERLALAARQSSASMLTGLQEGTRGLVTNLDLMTSANKAMLLGLPVTADAMGELAKTATTLGKAMGQDATQSLDDLITALGRSSPLILDNLGLTVKVGEANEKYAKSLGVSVDSLDDAQRKMAFYTAAMEAARIKTKELGDQSLTLGERMSQVWVEIENNATRGLSNMNVVLGKATESWGDFFRFLKDSASFKSWQEQADKIRPAPTPPLPFIDATALARESKAYQDDLAQAAKDYEAWKDRIKKASEDLKRNLIKNDKDRADATVKSSEESRKAWQEQYAIVKKANEGITDGISGIAERSKVELEWLNQISKQLTVYRDAIDSVNSKIKIGLDSAPGLQFSPEQLFDPALLKKAGKTAGDTFGRELSQAIIGAIQGGGDIGKTIGAVLGKEMGEKIGESIAGTAVKGFKKFLGDAMGPLGALAGQALGGLFDKIFGKSQSRKDVEAFADSFGGFDKLQKKLETLPKGADVFWRALTQGGAKSKDAIDAVTEAFRLQEEAMSQTVPTYAEASAAAEKLGLDITKIGDGMNQLRVNDSAAEIAAAWETLKKSGADMEQVAAGAADKFQALVIEALKWGHTLPEAMRDPLKKMVDMGLITDDAGEKLADLSGIKFEKPLQAAIDSLITKLDELIDKITHGVGGALRGLPTGLDVDIPALASGGIVTRPTLALIGEAGPEAVVPLGGGRGFGGGGGPIVVQTFLDGYQIAEATVPHIPDVVRRRG